MARRPTPLNESDPAARVAIELRRLRDRAIASHGPSEVPSVRDISRRSGVAESTIYAALRGRLPNRETLIAIVDAWTDPTSTASQRERVQTRNWWLGQRAKAEKELETRRRTGDTPASTKPIPPGRTARSVRDADAINNRAIQAFAADLRALRGSDPRSLRQLSRATGELDQPPAKRKYHADYGLPVTTLSYMFRGQRFQPWVDVKKLVRVLDGDVVEWKEKWMRTAATTTLSPQGIESAERDER